MKKKIICSLMLVVALLMCGCGGSLVVKGNELANTINASADGVKEGAANASLKINEGQVLKINAEVKKGVYEVIFVKNSNDNNVPLEIKDIKDEDIALKFEVDKNETMTKEIPAGEYQVWIKAKDKATGNIDITLENK
ncbi:MAG: hypothetical protein HUJ63_05970 [Enterococcus sp.]|nr:hypothetical protein [Enterococcus sp.]